jgi:bifunctional enzyme CysN/CysC
MPPTPAEPVAKEMMARDLLHCITCGSLDDGKSTLIGRLLHDSRLILEDQLVTLAQTRNVTAPLPMISISHF